MPGGESELGALLKVFEEDIAHPAVEVAVIDHEAAFEIVFEAPEVEIGRADGRNVVVDDHALGVKHPRVVEIDLDAGFQTLRNV